MRSLWLSRRFWTIIQAHDHPDDRVATVVSGTWYLGYGTKFDDKKLKELSPGSFYTEPPEMTHFARTGKTAVLIIGYGPTGTKYFDSSDAKIVRVTGSRKITNEKR